MIAISADPVSLVSSTAESLRLTFPLLSDESTETIGAYNVIDPTEIEVARRAAYIIDRTGRVVWRFVGLAAESGQILTELKKF